MTNPNWNNEGWNNQPGVYNPIVINQTPPRQSTHLLTDILMFWFGWTMRGRHDEHRRQQAALQAPQTKSLPPTITTRGTTPDVDPDGDPSLRFALQQPAFLACRDILERLADSDVDISPEEMRLLHNLQSLSGHALTQIDLESQLGGGVNPDLIKIPMTRNAIICFSYFVEKLLASSEALSQEERARYTMLRDLLGILRSQHPTDMKARP
jgi:hypothetical protein